MKQARPIIRRLLAFIIDLAATLLVIPLTTESLVQDRSQFMLVTFVLTLGYWSSEIFYASSPGKWVTRLQIADHQTSKKPDTASLAIRFVTKHFVWIFPVAAEILLSEVPLLPGMVALAGYLLVIFSDNRALHDVVSGTAVTNA